MSLALPAFLPSAILFFLPKISGGDPPLLTLSPFLSVLYTPLLFFSFCVLLSAEVLITFSYIFSQMCDYVTWDPM